jgi:hypothetical protein
MLIVSLQPEIHNQLNEKTFIINYPAAAYY